MRTLQIERSWTPRIEKIFERFRMNRSYMHHHFDIHEHNPKYTEPPVQSLSNCGSLSSTIFVGMYQAGCSEFVHSCMLRYIRKQQKNPAAPEAVPGFQVIHKRIIRYCCSGSDYVKMSECPADHYLAGFRMDEDSVNVSLPYLRLQQVYALEEPRAYPRIQLRLP